METALFGDDVWCRLQDYSIYYLIRPICVNVAALCSSQSVCSSGDGSVLPLRLHPELRRCSRGRGPPVEEKTPQQEVGFSQQRVWQSHGEPDRHVPALLQVGRSIQEDEPRHGEGAHVLVASGRTCWGSSRSWEQPEVGTWTTWRCRTWSVGWPSWSWTTR